MGEHVNTPEGCKYGSCPFSQVIAFGKSSDKFIRLVHLNKWRQEGFYRWPYLLLSFFPCWYVWYLLMFACILLGAQLAAAVFRQDAPNWSLDSWTADNDQDILRHLGNQRDSEPILDRSTRYWGSLQWARERLHFHVLSPKVLVLFLAIGF